MNKYKGFSKMWFLALLLVAFMAGCASNGTEVNRGALVSVTVTPPLASIPVTGTQQYTVTAIYGNGSSQDVTALSAWTATNVPAGGAAVATVSSTVPTKGFATGKVVGTSTITATYLGMVKTATLTVNAATATKFEVKPTAFSIPVTGTQKFTAIETFSDGTSYDRASTWSAANLPLGGAAVATIGATTGIATGKVVGTATITATYAASPLSPATATLNVNKATSLGLILSPATASIPVTGNQQYTLLEIFSDGTSVPRTIGTIDSPTVWSTSNNAGNYVSLISSGATAGLASGLIATPAGTPVTVSATNNGTTVTATLTVNAARSMGFTLNPASASIPVTGNQQYTLLEIFSDGTSVPRTIGTIDSPTTWSTSNNAGNYVSLISSGATAGLASGLIATPAGTPVTVSATNNGTTVTATLTVNAATSLGLTVTPLTATISINGGGQQFAAFERFTDGSTIERTTDSANTWSSVDLTGGPGVSTIGLHTGMATGAAIGTSTITATYTVGSVVLTGSAILTVTAPDPGVAGSAPNLRTASTYGIIATNAITSSDANSHIYGDVALTVGVSSSVTGPNLNDVSSIPNAAPHLASTGVTTTTIGVNGSRMPGEVNTADNGNLSIAQMAQLQADLLAAYTDLSTRPATTTYPAGVVELSGKVLEPGIYKVGTASDTYALSDISGPLVLDAKGNPDAIFIFQADKITTTTGSVVLQGGAQAKNVFWVLTSDATIGNGISTFFQGTVVAGNTITVGLNTNVQGRMLAGALGAGSITNSGVITVPK